MTQHRQDFRARGTLSASSHVREGEVAVPSGVQKGLLWRWDRGSALKNGLSSSVGEKTEINARVLIKGCKNVEAGMWHLV